MNKKEGAKPSIFIASYNYYYYYYYLYEYCFSLSKIQIRIVFGPGAIPIAIQGIQD